MSQRAMDGYDALGGPGHDLDGDGWASSLIVRADARFHLGDKAGSAADFATALGRLEKEMVPHADRLIKADIHREQLDELCALASNYRSRASRLRRAIETLREAGGAAMPCLLPPWPARIL